MSKVSELTFKVKQSTVREIAHDFLLVSVSGLKTVKFQSTRNVMRTMSQLCPPKYSIILHHRKQFFFRWLVLIYQISNIQLHPYQQQEGLNNSKSGSRAYDALCINLSFVGQYLRHSMILSLKNNIVSIFRDLPIRHIESKHGNNKSKSLGLEPLK